jgi:hypothetical protein
MLGCEGANRLVKTTPFNTHHDLPLIVANQDLLACGLSDVHIGPSADKCDLVLALEKTLERVSYDFARIELIDILNHRGRWIVDLRVCPTARTSLPEIIDTSEISIIVEGTGPDQFDFNILYYAMMDAFIALSDRHVDEHFKYRGVARFSRQQSVTKLAKLSAQMRDNEKAFAVNTDFQSNFMQSNYETDESRIPTLRNGVLGDKIKASLSTFGDLAGMMPAMLKP